MLAMLAEYEQSFKARPVNLLKEEEEERPSFDNLSDAMMRATLVTGVSSSELLMNKNNSGSLRRTSDSVIYLPKCSVSC